MTAWSYSRTTDIVEKLPSRSPQIGQILEMKPYRVLGFSVWISGVTLLGEEEPQGAEEGLLGSSANHLCNSQIEL